MNETIIDRIKLIISKKGLSESKFANLIGFNQMTVNRWLKGTTMPIDCIIRICEVFPDISAEWLLRGEGECDKKIETNLHNKSVLDRLIDKLPNCGDAEYYEKELDKRDKQIRQLSLENNRYSMLFAEIKNNNDDNIQKS